MLTFLDILSLTFVPMIKSHGARSMVCYDGTPGNGNVRVSSRLPNDQTLTRGFHNGFGHLQ